MVGYRLSTHLLNKLLLTYQLIIDFFNNQISNPTHPTFNFQNLITYPYDLVSDHLHRLSIFKH
jgi:hypothetical protein